LLLLLDRDILDEWMGWDGERLRAARGEELNEMNANTLITVHDSIDRSISIDLSDLSD